MSKKCEHKESEQLLYKVCKFCHSTEREIELEAKVKKHKNRVDLIIRKLFKKEEAPYTEEQFKKLWFDWFREIEDLINGTSDMKPKGIMGYEEEQSK
jgi:hypothetical protein